MYYLYHWKNSKIFDRYIEGLKKAGYKDYLEKLIKRGCKEDPFVYYKLNKKNRMAGQEIRELLFGKTIRGFYFCTVWASKINKSGKVVSNDLRGMHKGRVWIENNKLCRQYENYLDELKFCAEIYKNPEGKKETLSEYLVLTDFFLFPVSIEE